MKYIYLLLFIPSVCFAQRQEQKLILYNVGFGAFTAAIGAVINKPKNCHWTKVFSTSLWQGGIGGLLHYTGKKCTYLINKQENLLYAWPAKLLHSAGSSIIENAALNKKMLQNWNIDIGPVRFDYSFTGSQKFRARFLPYSIYGVIAGLQNGHFDGTSSLLTGNLTFKSNSLLSGNTFGYSYGRAIAYTNDSRYKYVIIAHEIVHQFQYSEYQVFNTWLNPLQSTIKNERVKAIFRNYIYLDLPWFEPAYALEGQHGGMQFARNFFELEAQRFATNRDVY